MANDYVAPIHHSTASAVSATTAGVAGGAVKGGLKWWAVVAAVGAGVGLLAGLALTGVITIPAGAIVSAISWGGLGKAAIIAATTIGGGVAMATTLGPVAAALGATVGGAKGGMAASRSVKQELGAAKVLDAQVNAYKAQAQAASQESTTNIYAPSASNDNKFNLPVHGDAMNMASPMGLQAGSNSMQYDGRVSGQQRAQAL